MSIPKFYLLLLLILFNLEIGAQSRSSNEYSKSFESGQEYYNNANYTKALESFLLALKISEETNDQEKTAICLKNIGNVYLQLRQHQQAISYYKRSADICKKTGNTCEGDALFNIGLTLIDMDHFNKALSFLNEAKSAYKTASNKQGESLVLSYLGYIETELTNHAKALNYYLEALAIQQEFNDKERLSETLRFIAEAYTSLGNYEKALSYQSKALELSQKINSKAIIRDNYWGLYNIYKQSGNSLKSLEYLEKYSELKDSIFSQESTAQIAEMQTKYDTEKKEQQIALLNKEQQKDRVIRYALITGGAMIFLMAFLIFNRYRLKNKANKLLTAQKAIIEEKNKDIADSISYAKGIQRSFLTPESEFSSTFKDHFILYKPKDIISGDCYWLANVTTTPKTGVSKKISVLSVIDCTGHGVPGALLSIVGLTLLNQTVRNPEVNGPADALNFLNSELPKNLRKQSEKQVMRDGMDMVMCAFDIHEKKIIFAGANNPVYLIRKGNLTEYKGDKQPISGADDIDKKPFSQQIIDIQQGDSVYLFTDGFADQFGGEKGKKFKYSKLKELLLSIESKSMQEQKEILNETFETWKGNLDQVDDVCLIGVKID